MSQKWLEVDVPEQGLARAGAHRGTRQQLAHWMGKLGGEGEAARALGRTHSLGRRWGHLGEM